MSHAEQQFESIPLEPIGASRRQPQHTNATAAVYDGMAVGSSQPAAAPPPAPKRGNKCKIACYGTAVIVGIIAVALIIIIFVAGSRDNPNAAPSSSSTSSMMSSTASVTSSSAKAAPASTTASAKASATARSTALPMGVTLKKRYFGVSATPTATATTTRPAPTATGLATTPKPKPSATATVPNSRGAISELLVHETATTASAAQTLGILQSGADTRAPADHMQR